MTTEERLQRLEDIEAIRRVTADYAAAINWGAGDAVDRDGIRAVLSEDIQWKAAAMKVDVRGIDAAMEVIGQPQPGMTLAMHSFSNPQIDVVGDTAKGNLVALGSDASWRQNRPGIPKRRPNIHSHRFRLAYCLH